MQAFFPSPATGAELLPDMELLEPRPALGYEHDGRCIQFLYFLHLFIVAN